MRRKLLCEITKAKFLWNTYGKKVYRDRFGSLFYIAFSVNCLIIMKFGNWYWTPHIVLTINDTKYVWNLYQIEEYFVKKKFFSQKT